MSESGGLWLRLDMGCGAAAWDALIMNRKEGMMSLSCEDKMSLTMLAMQLIIRKNSGDTVRDLPILTIQCRATTAPLGQLQPRSA